ncbi:hypothetical protein I550_0248 [Mycobacterium intracellulare 1956]|uniref:Uncharacterized protein n=1 Tax=Mycobacterium intracellulare 1956 TaxID=1299331 RepID=X8CNT3_MYCIT|nr:hypothetical protein I550_0248 [Mycobacterium intracellulare 1956]
MSGAATPGHRPLGVERVVLGAGATGHRGGAAGEHQRLAGVDERVAERGDRAASSPIASPITSPVPAKSCENAR